MRPQSANAYDAAGRPWAAVDRKHSTAAGNTHSVCLVTDDRGDVLELLEADHIAFGSYRYDVYGRPTETTARTTSTTAMDSSWMAPITSERSLLRYAGYSYDAHSELYYLQRRYYDPILRQFLSRDPLKSDGPESPYQYCGGNPVAGTDPWGLYVTASGGRTNTRFYVPQSGRTYRAGNAPDFWGAPPTTAPPGSGPLARWRGSLGGGEAPGWAGARDFFALNSPGEFLHANLNAVAYLTMCPFAEGPFGDNLNAELGFSAALMFVDPLLGVRAGARGSVLLLDDTVRVTVSAVRGVGAGDDIVRTQRGTGQLHHAISQAVYRALREHPNLAGQYTARDSRFVTRAVDLEAHRGYQTWHRALDDEVALAVRRHPEWTTSDFEAFLRRRYEQPDLCTRFCDGP